MTMAQVLADRPNSWLASVKIGAVDSSCYVLDGLTLTKGRGNPLTQPDPGSATIRLVITGPAGLPDLGAYVEIHADLALGGVIQAPFHVVVMAGTIVDQHWDQDVGVLELTITDILAWWGQAQIGDNPWPSETAAARAQRIVTLAGAPPQIGSVALRATLDPVTVAARDVDRQPTLGLLQDLGGLLDAPLNYWAGEHVLEMASVDRRDDRGELGTHWFLDPCAVVTDWEPQRSVSDVINQVDVNYTTAAGVQGTGHAEDAASVAAYGGRHLGYDTPLTTQADAAALASLRIFRSADPAWRLSSVNILGDRLTAENDRDVMRVLLAYTMGIYLAIGPVAASEAPPFPISGLVSISEVPGDELLDDPGFAHGAGPSNTSWTSFWTNVTPGWQNVDLEAYLVRSATVPGGTIGRLGQLRGPIPVLPGQRYRLSIRHRLGINPGTGATTQGSVDLAMLTAPTAAGCDWFSPTVTIQGKTTPGSGQWTTYTWDGTIPAGHFWLNPYYSSFFADKGDGVIWAGGIEMDDASCRRLTQDIRLDVIAEGMTATYTSEDGWLLELAVSNRTQSWAVISWQDLNGASTADTKWSDVSPTLIWSQVSDVSQFGG